MKKVKVPEAEKLPSGSFRCRVMVNGQKKSFTAPTKREAEQAAMEYKLGLDADAPAPRRDMPLAELSDS